MEKELKKEVYRIVKASSEIVIMSKEDNEFCSELLKKVLTVKKAVLDYWREPVEKAYNLHRELTKRRNEMVNPLEKSEKILKSKMAEFLMLTRKKAEEEEKKLREEAEKEGLKVQVKLPDTKAERQVVKTMWEVEVVDKSKVPEEYKIVDIPRLRKVAQTFKGEKQVPGIKFVKKLNVTVR